MNLFRENIEVNMQDKHGKTALMWATENHHGGIVTLLEMHSQTSKLSSRI